MYKLLLTFRYLRRKLIPWFALLAVTLCTAMVIIVGSVMGGFLDLVRDAGKSVMGDVVIVGGVDGLPFYDDIIKEVEATDEARAATPIINTFGLLKLPGNRISYVGVYGVYGRRYAEVTDYGSTLYWNTENAREELGERFRLFDPQEAGLDLVLPGLAEDGGDLSGIVPGIEISPYSHRNQEGQYEFRPAILAMVADLTVMPIQRGGTPADPSIRRFAVVNEFHSGFYLVDSRRVYIPFEAAQRMLLMHEGPKVDMNNPTEIIGTVPGRCSEIHIAAAEGVDSTTLKTAVIKAYDRVAAEHEELPDSIGVPIVTWQENSRQYVEAIEHEKGLLTVLFGIISLVAVVMIAVIFYMIVLEKTRDIGILRSIGASRSGVAGIFLLYGAVIGVIGAALGLLLSFTIVGAINELHAWLGKGVGASLFGAGIIAAGLALGGLPGVIWGRLNGANDRSRVGDRVLWWLGTIALGAVVLGPLGMALGVCLDAIILKYLATPWNVAYLDTVRQFLFTMMDRSHSWLAMPPSVFAGIMGYLLMVLLVATVIWRHWARMLLLCAAVLSAGGAYLLLRFLPDLLEFMVKAVSVVIWDKSVYFFDSIPARIDPVELSIVLIVAIVASVIGALVPAIKAARLHPVESLRYE